MHPKITGERLRGASVDLARPAPDGAESAWNVLAYEVTLKGRGGVALTRRHFEQAVANFERYGRRCPVTLYHADTDASAHPEARKAVGWVKAMRVGSMERPSVIGRTSLGAEVHGVGRRVATLEAQLELGAAARAAVTADPPELAYGSVTIVPDAVDEESGERVGAFLYSFTLTNNPALVELPRIQVSDDRGTAATKEPSMKFIAMAARLGVPAETEEAAESAVIALATEAADVRKALGTASLADTAAKLSALRADAAKVPALETEVARLGEERVAETRRAYIDDVMLARGFDEDMRVTLEFHAKADWVGFQAKFPRASKTELSQRAQDGHRFERLSSPRGKARETSADVDDAGPTVGEIESQAAQLMAAAAAQGGELSFMEALAMIPGGSPAFGAPEGAE
jgi:hypothetical protein